MRPCRLNVALIMLCCILTLSCCGKKSQTYPEEESDYIEADSTVFTTPDLTLYHLVGPVISCTTLEDPAVNEDGISDNILSRDSVSYDNHGRLTSQSIMREYDGNTYTVLDIGFIYDDQGEIINGVDKSVMPYLKANLERDMEGHPSALSVFSEAGTYENNYFQTYEWKDGQLYRSVVRADEINSKSTYEYEENSIYPLVLTIETEDMEGTIKTIEKYIYTDFDSYGNWTKRKVEIITISAGYDNNEKSEEVRNVSHRTDYRRIRYRSQ